MEKAKKGKITLIISIACTAFILTMVMFTQIKTVNETDITGIETMRESELRAELAGWKEKYNDVNAKIEETESKIEEYNSQINDNKDVTALLQSELAEKNKYAGYTDVKGEGIVIKLEDTDNSQIVALDLIRLIRELKLAGAEAISINDFRVVSTTDLIDIDSYIFINTDVDGINKMTSPYVVKAIGNKRYLESAITVKYGYIDTLETDNKKIDYYLNDDISIFKYTKNLDYKTAKEVEE